MSISSYCLFVPCTTIDDESHTAFREFFLRYRTRIFDPLFELPSLVVLSSKGNKIPYFPKSHVYYSLSVKVAESPIVMMHEFNTFPVAPPRHLGFIALRRPSWSSSICAHGFVSPVSSILRSPIVRIFSFVFSKSYVIDE